MKYTLLLFSILFSILLSGASVFAEGPDIMFKARLNYEKMVCARNPAYCAARNELAKANSARASLKWDLFWANAAYGSACESLPERQVERAQFDEIVNKRPLVQPCSAYTNRQEELKPYLDEVLEIRSRLKSVDEEILVRQAMLEELAANLE